MTESKKSWKFKSWTFVKMLSKPRPKSIFYRLWKAWPFQWPGKVKIGILLLCLFSVVVFFVLPPAVNGNRRDGRVYTFGNSLVLQAKVTKREYIATHIMAQMMAVRSTPDLQWSAKILAAQSVAAADWLIFELDKPEKGGK